MNEAFYAELNDTNYTIDLGALKRIRMSNIAGENLRRLDVICKLQEEGEKSLPIGFDDEIRNNFPSVKLSQSV